MHSTRPAHKRRVDADQKVVDEISVQLRLVRRDSQLAEEALALAAAKLDSLRVEARLLEARERVASDNLAESRAASLRVFLSTIADDVLACVFTHITELPDEHWKEFGSGGFNLERTSAPFNLAAVCSHWRRVAIALPTLWNYISLQSSDTRQATNPQSSIVPLAAHFDRIELSLARSKNAGLEILLHWEYYDLTAHDDERSLVTAVMAALSKHAWRWRRVEIAFPAGCSRDIAEVLKGPTPILTHLSLIGHHNEQWLENAEEGFFPHAPRLRFLDLVRTGMYCAPFHAGFPSLVVLKIINDLTCEHLLRILGLAQTTLQHLDLDIQFQDNPSSPVALPSLNLLRLDNEIFFVSLSNLPMLNAPRLCSLSLRASAVVPALATLLDHLSETITHLTLYGEISNEVLTHLACLRKLSHLFFDPDPEADCTVSDGFFLRLALPEPCIWPQLRSIVFKPGSDVDPPNGSGLIRLLAQRNARTPNTAAAEHPVKLQEVVVHSTAPAWLAAEVDRLRAL